MKYNELDLTPHRKRKRLGRGIAAGQGKTAGRGTKGQKSRTGKGKRPGFEGGQNPLAQRLPKLPGFTSHLTPATNVYTGQLDRMPLVIDNQALVDAGIVESAHVVVKVIQKGEVSKKHTIKLQGISAGALAAVQKAGGSFVQTSRVPRPASKKSAEAKS